MLEIVPTVKQITKNRISILNPETEIAFGKGVIQPQFDAVMSAVADRLAPGARVVWRSLHTDYPLTAETAARLVVDRELGRELQAGDKFPFYDIMPAERL